MKAIKITVSGKVQGVYFRASTKDYAMLIGVKGWVKNQRDGTVLIHAEGITSQLTELIAWCHQGPEGAKVASVETHETALENSHNFDIKRS